MECRVLALLFPTPTGVVVVAATVTILAARITRLISRNGHILAFDNLSGRQPWLRITATVV